MGLWPDTTLWVYQMHAGFLELQKVKARTFVVLNLVHALPEKSRLEGLGATRMSNTEFSTTLHTRIASGEELKA